MKLQGYSDRRFGIGSNPSGGIYIDVIPETSEEEQFFQSLARQPGHSCVRGRYGPYWHICKRLTTHVDDWPMDGGPNPAWKKLAERLGIDPIAWAKQQKEKEAKEANKTA